MRSARNGQRRPGQHASHGEIGYLQLPAIDIASSAEFYRAVFGWSIGDPGIEPGNGVLLWFGDVADSTRSWTAPRSWTPPWSCRRIGTHPTAMGTGPGIASSGSRTPDGYTVVVASPDGEAFEP